MQPSETEIRPLEWTSDERLADLAAERWTGPGPTPRPFDYDRRHKFADDDEIAAFESRHGHDPRLKCYPEFGCQAIDYECAQLAAELVSLRGKLAKVRELAEDGINARSFSLRQCWAEFVAINVAAGGPDPRCGATDGHHVCIQIAGHVTPDGLHDDGSFAFFVTGSEVPA